MKQKQNTGGLKYKLKCLDDGQIYTVSELSDALCIDERLIYWSIKNNRKIYNKKYVKVEAK